MLTAEVVPVTFIEGITPQDSAILAEHGIETIEQLAAASVDDLCDWLDLSVDEAEEQLATVREIVAVREAALAHHEHVLAPEAKESEAEAKTEAAAEEVTLEATSSTAEATETASEEVATEEAGEEPTETVPSEETIAAEEPDKTES
jgi:nucleotidyltransferase/DNA polymerase involved in DNA repair